MLKQLQVQCITESDRQVRWSLNIAVEEEILYGKKKAVFLWTSLQVKSTTAASSLKKSKELCFILWSIRFFTAIGWNLWTVLGHIQPLDRPNAHTTLTSVGIPCFTPKKDLEMVFNIASDILLSFPVGVRGFTYQRESPVPTCSGDRCLPNSFPDCQGETHLHRVGTFNFPKQNLTDSDVSRNEEVFIIDAFY